MIQQITSCIPLFTNDFRSNEDLEKDLREKYQYYGYFLNKDKLVSYICFYELSGSECEIHYVVTDDKYRNQGYAAKLLNNLIANHPNYTFFLEVNENNAAAVNLYKKNGFKIINKRNNYYPDGNALIMQRKG